jgi:hypothetical protein
MATPARERTSRTARTPVPRRRRWILLAGSVLTLVGAGLVVRHFLADDRVRHRLPVAWPEEAPRGEPIRIGHAVKAGDVFLTTLDFQSGVILGFDPPDPFLGMRLDGTLRIGHGVTERPGGLTSTIRVVLYLIHATYAPMQEAIASPLRRSEVPYTVVFDREADGRPVPGSVSLAHAPTSQRQALDTVMAGLGDVRTNWIPDRPIRLGEAWDVTEVADVLPNVLAMLRRAAGATGDGFPEPAVRGRVAAEALETRDGEPCVRLRLACGAGLEGYAKAPAAEAWVTAAARVEGPIWVSTATGIVWGMDLTADLQSSYMIPNRAQLRNARQRLTAKTERADAMPE